MGLKEINHIEIEDSQLQRRAITVGNKTLGKVYSSSGGAHVSSR